MDLAKKKILVTGADGFIGSQLVENLVKNEHDVRALVLYNSFNSWGWLDHCPPDIHTKLDVFPGDIRDSYQIRKAMQDCQVVIHLAALVGIPYSYQAPASYLDTNIKGTLNILQAALDMGIEKVVHTSSSEVYGSARWVPMDEEHPLQAQSPYSASKIGADQLALSFHRSFGLPVAIIRPFNTYGPRQSARAVIPTIISQLNDGKHSIRLGSLYPTRDFNYVEDTINGFIAIASSDKSIGQVINIGSNYEISIGELPQLIADIIGVKVKIEADPNRLRPENSEVDRLWADNRKAQRLLGWEPEYGGQEGLIRGLTKTIAWFSQASNLKQYHSERYNI